MSLSPERSDLASPKAKTAGKARTPLLAAFSHLEQERLVETYPRRGAYVRRYTRDELLNIYDIRCRLEPLGARGAAIHAGPEGVEAVERLLAAFQASATNDDLHALKRADYDFHMEVMRRGGNTFLYDMLATFNIIVIANTKGLLKPAEQSAREHVALMEALRAGDPDEAERVMFEHLSGSRANLLRGDVFVDGTGR